MRRKTALRYTDDKADVYKRQGDMCLQPVSLGMDVPHSSFNAAIMNSAYAGKIMIQEQQYQALLSSVQKALTAGGKVLLPVPQKGRGIDLFLFLKKKLPNTRIYVEQDIIDSLKSLSEKEQWIQEPIDVYKRQVQSAFFNQLICQSANKNTENISCAKMYPHRCLLYTSFPAHLP